MTQGSARSCVSIRRGFSLCHSEPLRRRIPVLVSARTGPRCEVMPLLHGSEYFFVSFRAESAERRIPDLFYGAAHTHDESRQVEEQNLGGGARDDRQFFFVADCGAVAFRECGAVYCDGAAGDLHPSVAALLQIGRDALPAFELCHRQGRVLVDRNRSIVALGSAYRCEAAVRLRVVYRFLLVARCDAACGWRDPDLQKMNRLGFRVIEFAVSDSAARAHPLRFARTNN